MIQLPPRTLTGIERFKRNDPSFFKTSSNEDRFTACKSILEVADDPSIALERTDFVKAKESLVEDTRPAWRFLCVCQIRPLTSRVSFSLCNQIAVSVALVSRYAYNYDYEFSI